MIALEAQRIELNDLPRFSDWPNRLLSEEPAAVRQKTEQEVLREYEREKWGTLLTHVRRMQDPSLSAVEEVFHSLEDVTPIYLEGGFLLAKRRDALRAQLDLYANVLREYASTASCLVELGAGYGSKLLSLASLPEFAAMPLVAAEYTRSGRELISLLTPASRAVAVGYCDFRKLAIDGIKIPKNALIFTSYAVHYVPQLSSDFVPFLSMLKPRAVVHFEPCYEYYPADSLHGLLCRRYVEVNDYVRNLATILSDAAARGEIRLQSTRNVFGENPLLPISVLSWSPADQ